MTTFRFGALEPRHRGRLAEILTATAAFSRDEVEVALELFDETFEGGGWRVEGRESVAGKTSALSPPATFDPSPSPSYEFLGAYDDAGALTGYACFGPTPGADGTFDLYWIAVHPAAQGGGQGSRLLDEIERQLRARDGRLLIVETSSREAYASTRRFYDARGYREAARVADFYAPADDRVIYTKRLTRAAAPATAAHSPPPH